MAETTKKDNDLVFLGINFNNFFKGCSCFKRVMAEGDNESVSSSGDLPMDLASRYQNCGPAVGDQLQLQAPVSASLLVVPQNEQPDIQGPHADWLELEEMPLQAANPIIRVIAAESQGMGPSEPIEPSAIEDFCTQDPIDFDYLKESVKFQDDDDSHSQASGLSKGSKKINKDLVDRDTKKARSKSANPKDNNNVKGRRRAWQPHEDAKVIELVGKYGQSWAVVASMMEGRTGKQIRDRYLNKLKPDIKKTDWTPEEDRALLGLYYQIGHKWSKIATYLPGRTEGQVKNRFYSHIKKKLTGYEASENYSGTRSSPMSEVNGNYQPMTGKEMDIDDGNSNEGQPINNFGRQCGPDSPAMSIMTTSTQETKIQTEDDVDNILDKLTGFMGKKGPSQSHSEASFDLEKMSIEDKIAYLNMPGPMNNVERLDKFEQLQKRKDKLELLLAQTLRDMGNVNPSLADI